MTWINIKEKEPKHKEDIIVYYVDEIGEEYITGGYKDWDTNNWELYYKNESVGHNDIAWWMPCPLPPIDSNNSDILQPIIIAEQSEAAVCTCKNPKYTIHDHPKPNTKWCNICEEIVQTG